MIICFNDKIKSFNKNNLNFSNDDLQNAMPTIADISSCKCPKCHAKANFSIHAYYNRNIVFISKNDNSIHEYNLSVTRVICNSCASTHALLPGFIVPYKSFSLSALLYIVSSVATSSVYHMANNLSLSYQFIYSILAIFFSFFYQVDLLNRETNFSKNNFNINYFSLNCLSLCNYDFLQLYFLHYNWIFLMTKFRNIPVPPIYYTLYFS